MRYVNEDVDSLLLDGSDKYVKRLVKMYGALGGPAKVEWVREEYRGKGIDLYSLSLSKPKGQEGTSRS